MEQHPRIELGSQVYETCTSPFMFMLQKLAEKVGFEPTVIFQPRRISSAMP